MSFFFCAEILTEIEPAPRCTPVLGTPALVSIRLVRRLLSDYYRKVKHFVRNEKCSRSFHFLHLSSPVTGKRSYRPVMVHQGKVGAHGKPLKHLLEDMVTPGLMFYLHDMTRIRQRRTSSVGDVVIPYPFYYSYSTN